jgi:hypothetical protein
MPDVSLNDFQARIASNVTHPLVPVKEVVEDTDAIVALQELSDQAGPDVTGPARDQNRGWSMPKGRTLVPLDRTLSVAVTPIRSVTKTF